MKRRQKIIKTIEDDEDEEKPPNDIDGDYSKDINGDVIQIKIHQLDPHTISPKNIDDDGARYTFIGRPGTGKSVCIGSILYYKRHIVPCGSIYSGTEDSSGFYGKHFPNLFMDESIEDNDVDNIIKRQKFSMKHLNNPWAFTLWDDISDDQKFLRTKVVKKIYKNLRHYKLLQMLALQYAMDILPVIRNCIDGTFIGREPSERTRKCLYENYATAIPSMPQFHAIMDDITENKTFLFINNKIDSNNSEDCLFYYKAPYENIPPNWKFGSESYWKFANSRCK